MCVCVCVFLMTSGREESMGYLGRREAGGRVKREGREEWREIQRGREGVIVRVRVGGIWRKEGGMKGEGGGSELGGKSEREGGRERVGEGCWFLPF